MNYIDIIFLGSIFIFWIFFFKSRQTKRNIFHFEIALSCYHFLISFFAYYYINEFGGDVRSYWKVVAIPETTFTDWQIMVSYSSAYFMILIYPFAGILGLSFFSGTLLFTSLSLLAFIWIYELVFDLTCSDHPEKTFWSYLVMLILFLPSAHFWTSLPGKETVLFFCLVIVVRKSLMKKYFVALVFLAASIFVRPAIGILILGAMGIIVFQDKRISKQSKIKIGALVGCLFGYGIYLISVFLEDFSLSASWLADYASAQYQRLSLSNPKTLFPVESSSWPYRIFSAAYRPILGDGGEGILMHLVKIENTIFLTLSLGLPFFVFQKPKFSPYLILIFSFFFIVAVISNVFGLSIRLKSIVTPFLALMGGFGWANMLGKFPLKFKD